MAINGGNSGITLWEGRPKEIRASNLLILAGILSYGLGIVSMAFGVVRALTLGDTSVTPLFIALWAVTLGALVHVAPVWWQSGVTYRVTARQVIWKRGPFQRTICRDKISFARIHWSLRYANIGCLELVCLTPLGGSRQNITIRLDGVLCPDGVWAIIRGAQDLAPRGHSELPISQRLDCDERIIWSAKPLPGLKAYLPSSSNQWYLSTVALGLFAVGAYVAVRGIMLLSQLSAIGLRANSPSFWGLATALLLGLTAVVAVGAFIAKAVIVNRAHHLRTTRYLISNKRVLIQCGRAELHLDRKQIVDVIELPVGVGKNNLLLVLDGPRKQALLALNALGCTPGSSDELLPIFECVQDSEGARLALSGLSPLPPHLPRAA